MYELFLGEADQSIDVKILNASDGTPLTGLTNASSGLNMADRRGVTGSATDIPPASLATIGTAHADGGFKEVSASEMPGIYRVDLPDAVAASASAPDYVTFSLQVTGGISVDRRIALITRVTPVAGLLPVNVKQIDDHATAAANLEAYCDGTTPMPVNATQIEGSDATNQIRDAVVDDATRIDASALNTLSGHDPGETIMGATDLGTGSGLTSLASAANLATVASYIDTEIASLIAAVAALPTAAQTPRPCLIFPMGLKRVSRLDRRCV